MHNEKTAGCSQQPSGLTPYYITQKEHNVQCCIAGLKLRGPGCSIYLLHSQCRMPYEHTTISTGWPNKVSHYQMIKKSYYIVSKPVNEIKFIRQLKV